MEHGDVLLLRKINYDDLTVDGPPLTFGYAKALIKWRFQIRCGNEGGNFGKKDRLVRVRRGGEGQAEQQSGEREACHGIDEDEPLRAGPSS
jgi:hypothetical protein